VSFLGTVKVVRGELCERITRGRENSAKANLQLCAVDL
jgi:hypothetical protein